METGRPAHSTGEPLSDQGNLYSPKLRTKGWVHEMTPKRGREIRVSIWSLHPLDDPFPRYNRTPSSVGAFGTLRTPVTR